MPNPTISIVTTVYDAKDYIPRTVRSILAQSFTDFELLLVEDGSPNGCGELCDELAKTDPRIRVFHKENGGTGGRRYFNETAALPGCEDGSAKAGQSRPEILSGRQDGRKGHNSQSYIRYII